MTWTGERGAAGGGGDLPEHQRRDALRAAAALRQPRQLPRLQLRRLLQRRGQVPGGILQSTYAHSRIVCTLSLVPPV